jgi:hypothetical protein
MGVAHLDGKRTGRPKGQKTRPYWQRAVQWVERHLGDDQPVPPSPLASLLLDQARERPDLFVLMLQAIEQRTAPSLVPQNGDGWHALACERPLREKLAYRQPQRVKRFMATSKLASVRVKLDEKLLAKLPNGWELLELATGNDDFMFVVRSPEFPEVRAFQPVPTERLEA